MSDSRTNYKTPSPVGEGWGGVLRVILLALLFLAVQLAAGGLMLLWGGLANLPQPFSATQLAVCLWVANVGIVLLATWPMKMVRWRTAFAGSGASLTDSLLMVVGALLFSFALNVLTEFAELPDLMELEFMLLVLHPLGVLAIAVVGPVCEELVFREAMAGTLLRGGVRVGWAVGVSSLLFGVLHGNPAQVPFAIAMGAMLAAIYCRTGNILLTSLIHVLNNSAAVLQLWLLGDRAPDFSLVSWMGGTYFACTYAALALLFSFLCFLHVTNHK